MGDEAPLIQHGAERAVVDSPEQEADGRRHHNVPRPHEAVPAVTEGPDQEQEQGMHAHGRPDRHLAERPSQ